MHISITTPFMPVTSDGKAPCLAAFSNLIEEPLQKAVKAARQMNGSQSEGTSVKTCVFKHMEELIGNVSDNRRYRFLVRQVWYRMRPIVANETGKISATTISARNSLQVTRGSSATSLWPSATSVAGSTFHTLASRSHRVP
jgi:hypothetical protein